MRDFESSMLVHDSSLFGCEKRPGLNKQGQSSRILSVPHSSATVDFDGDCMNDLFLTVTDSSGKSFYEIYVRKETDELSKSN